jgi:hypothetical protein
MKRGETRRRVLKAKRIGRRSFISDHYIADAVIEAVQKRVLSRREKEKMFPQ